MDFSRRRLLELAALAATLPGATAFLGPWLEVAPRQDYAPQFFDKDDFAALEAFTAILIPTDDTPGAREARCAQFIDFLLHAASNVDSNVARQWRTAMQALRDAGFHAADAKARQDLVAAMSRPERERGATHPAYFAYRLIKQQNTFAFYTSRQGLIDCLEYKGNSYNAAFPACDHPEHHTL
jgi:hypothetical protein